MNEPIHIDPSERHTIPEMFCRAFWMMLGPMMLIPVTFKIIEYGNGWLTVFDFVFLGVLAAMLLARAFEFFKGNPRTADGTPATRAHLRKYAAGVIGVGLPLWVIANVLGNYVMNDA